jgi:hypothetical protein
MMSEWLMVDLTGVKQLENINIHKFHGTYGASGVLIMQSARWLRVSIA